MKTDNVLKNKVMENKKSITSKIKTTLCSKNFILFCTVLFIAISPTFADGESIDALDTWGEKILSLFTSSWIKVLLLVALVVEAIGMVVAGQNGGGGAIIKKFAPWIIGTLIILCASGIVGYFVGDLEFTVSMTSPLTQSATLV